MLSRSVVGWVEGWKQVLQQNQVVSVERMCPKPTKILMQKGLVGQPLQGASQRPTLRLGFGAELSEGSGSRVRVYLNGVRAVFHRPHPAKEVDKGAVKSLRRFLVEAGIRPE